jgi:hypothetical protein
MFRPVLGPTQPLIQLLHVSFSGGKSDRVVKLITHLYLVSRSKNAWNYLHSPNVFMAWCLVKHRDNFTLLQLTPWGNHSWAANSHSASQENLQLLQNPKVHYCVHKSLLLVPILSEMHPIHTMPPYYPKIHSNIIFPSFLYYLVNCFICLTLSHRQYSCYTMVFLLL